ncbi:MAG: class I SAM-dependent methyltransferase [Fimbriiglobus sp.]
MTRSHNPHTPRHDHAHNGHPVPRGAAHHPGPDWWLMVRKFIRHGTNIASVAPSSQYLARMILKGIDWDTAKCVVELGAGTGPVTVELLRRAKPHTKIVIVEIDHDFCNRLRARFPQADIVEGNAAQLDELLKARGIDTVDHIVSGLPLPSFTPELRESIMASAAKCLGETGVLRQLTNMPFVYWKMYKKYYADVRFRLVPINLPPAGVYFCRGFKTKTAAAAGA